MNEEEKPLHKDAGLYGVLAVIGSPILAKLTTSPEAAEKFLEGLSQATEHGWKYVALFVIARAIRRFSKVPEQAPALPPKKERPYYADNPFTEPLETGIAPIPIRREPRLPSKPRPEIPQPQDEGSTYTFPNL